MVAARVISFLFPSSSALDNDDLYLVVNAIDHYDKHLHKLIDDNEYIDVKKTNKEIIRLHRIKDRITRVADV